MEWGSLVLGVFGLSAGLGFLAGFGPYVLPRWLGVRAALRVSSLAAREWLVRRILEEARPKPPIKREG